MILSCPQCATRYQTDAALFGAEGRNVRCAKCGNTWHQTPPAEPIESDPDPPLTVDPEPRGTVEPPPAPDEPQRPAYVPAPYAPAADALRVPQSAVAEDASGPIDPAGVALVAVGWIALAALIVAIGWSALRFRQEIATLWPQTASIFAALDMPVNTTGFAIANVHSRNQTENGQTVLAITGRLTNITSHELSVPPLRATLSDDDSRVLYNWSFSANVPTLAPGHGVNFVTRLSSPPMGARHLQIQIPETGK
ncbi:MAG TPA: DUF3426 domain-containing protein [Rhizomicrobium sp.]